MLYFDKIFLNIVAWYVNFFFFFFFYCYWKTLHNTAKTILDWYSFFYWPLNVNHALLIEAIDSLLSWDFIYHEAVGKWAALSVKVSQFGPFW